MTSVEGTAASRLRTSIGALVVMALLGAGLSTSTAVADVTKPKVAADQDAPTSLKVDWTAVKGAASYQVQYATSQNFSGSTTTLPAKGQPAITDSAATLTGLAVGKVYFVRVAEVGSDGKVGAFSAATQATPKFAYAAPGDLFRTKVTRSSMTVSWQGVGGNVPGYSLAASAAGESTKYFTTTTTSVKLSGLKKNTAYTLKVHAVRPASGGTAESRLSPDSPAVTQSTTTYSLATPDGLKETSQSASTVGIAWTAVAGAPDGAKYKVSYALDKDQTDHQKSTGALSGTTGKLTGLNNDTTYFAIIWLVDKDGDRISASSDIIVAKSIVPRGTIDGEVTGVSGSDLTAAAYTTSGNVAKAVTVGKDNKYSLDVRPGSYKVQLMYTGGGNYASAWARSGSDGGWTYGAASTIEVATSKTTNAPDVEIHKGHVISGKVVTTGGSAIRDVDLTAIAERGSERDVISLTRSSGGDGQGGKDADGLKEGEFSLQGLSSGTYWIRAAYSGDGFKIESREVSAGSDPGIRVVMDTAPFRKRYGASIHGTRKVGKTLSVAATRWLAGSYPTTEASMSFQWKRNGSAIRGATRSTYKLTGSDRGKRITVTATAHRYGYTTGSVTSSSKKIS